MSKPSILVTGASGKTGAPVVEQLLQRGFAVRALVRIRDDRAARLETLGAEVVLGDFLDLQSMRRAMRGVKRAYFCYPPHIGGLVEATSIAAIAAREAGVETVVNMSQISARDDSLSPVAREHWIAENVLDWADIGAVHIRPTFFAEMLFILGGTSIAREGKLYLPYGTGRHAPVTADDIASVVVGILADPAFHVGERYVVTGARNMTIAEMTDVLAEELGRPVEYVDLPVEEWGRVLRESVGLTELLVTHVMAVARDHQDGLFSAQTDVVHRVGGRPPQSLEAFIRANRDQFTEETARIEG